VRSASRAFGGGGIRAGGGNVREEGVATVLVAICVATLVIVTGTAVQLGAVLLARHRAEAAADLAALAAAALVLGGTELPCAAAERYARANGAELVSCTLDSFDVRIQVSVRVRAGPLVGVATGRARAGPALDSTALAGG
jgi:secretion/DNA translocation related TadE-like protein